MPSLLDIVNQVLVEIGRLPVSNVQQDDQSAQLIQAKIPTIYPLLLQKTDWNFAIVYRSDNTPLTMAFSPEYNYAYQLPADYSQMDRIWQPSFGFRIIDGQLLTNAKPISYYYVSSTQDYTLISPYFYRALVLYVAYTVALVLTQRKELVAYLENQYQKILGQAIAQNDQERQITQMPHNDFNRITFV